MFLKLIIFNFISAFRIQIIQCIKMFSALKFNAKLIEFIGMSYPIITPAFYDGKKISLLLK